MRIKDKIKLDKAGLEQEGPITIVAFGDSVTHGALASGEINYETVYWNRLKQKINAVRSYMPVNVINAGIGGLTAKGSLGRMERDVFKHEPDLVIVCFGLNDVNRPLEDYIGSLEIIFDRALKSDAEVIFMTPNMLNTYVAEGTAEVHLNYAAKTAEMQNGGRMDMYMAEAVKLAERMGVEVCDCYSEWKKLAEREDTTRLLANHINHPIKEMHELFAQKLFDIIFADKAIDTSASSDTMYQQ